MTSDKKKEERKARLNALIKLAEENIKTNPALRVMRDDYVPQSERTEEQEKQRLIAVEKMEHAAENIRKKRAEREASREAFKEEPIDPAKAAWGRAHPVVLNNWEKEKGRVNAAKNIGLGLMKKEVSPHIKGSNKDIISYYNQELHAAVESYIHSGFEPSENHQYLNMKEIIKELKPERKHLEGYQIRHYITSAFFDLRDSDDLKKYYHPKNLYFKKVGEE